jgi:hypothetical protein
MKAPLAALLVLFASIASASPKPPPEGPRMHKNVLVRGMWFPNAACTKRFGKQRTIKKAEHRVLATCLRTLQELPETRTSANTGAQILAYAPGMEIELGFHNGALYYVGYPHANPSRVPMITAALFEQLRKTGSVDVDKLVGAQLDAEAKSLGAVAAWIEVCLDAKGAMKASIAEASSPAAGAAFLAATADWTFEPFMAGKKPLPVCSLSLLMYPAAKAPHTAILPRFSIPDVAEVDGLGVVGGVFGGSSGVWTPGVGYGPVPDPGPSPSPPMASPQNVPPTLLETQRLTGSKDIAPDDATKTEIVRSGKDKIMGAFKLCVDPQGAVINVAQLKTTGFAAYDAKIQREMKTWSYKPYSVNGKAAPVCSVVSFVYTP